MNVNEYSDDVTLGNLFSNYEYASLLLFSMVHDTTKLCLADHSKSMPMLPPAVDYC